MRNGNGVFRFGPFEADVHTEELRKYGTRLRLPRQSFAVLLVLLEQRGQLVTRDDLQKKLWSGDTFVDFDHGLNAAVNRLREALADSPDTPKFIETLPKRGYRFVAAVEHLPANGPELLPSPPQSESGHSFIERNTSAESQGTQNTHVPGARTVLILSLSLLAAGFGAAYWHSRQAHPDISAKLIVKPFTTLRGQEVSPSFSPDGNEVVFAWDGGNSNQEKRFDLYVKVLGSESLLRLTSKPAEWLVPAWSPDGRTIAFFRDAGYDSGVFSVPAIGGPEKKLASVDTQFASATLSWSPDGKQLAYTEFNPLTIEMHLTSLRILSLETGEITAITNPEGCVFSADPIFSPDGRWIAFACALSAGLRGIYLLPRNHGDPHRIFSATGNPSPMAWSADSKRIILQKEGTLSEVDLNGLQEHPLLFARGGVYPAVSDRGGRLAFSSMSDNVNLWALDLVKTNASPKLLIASTRSQIQPDISADDTKIAFVSNRSGSQELWMSGIDGSDPVQLTDFHSNTGSARWSPDGSKIVFDSRESGTGALYWVDPVAALPRRIPVQIVSASVPNWSRDGKWIYFTCDRTPASGIYKVPLRGGNPVLVSHTVGYNVQESRDGSLYFAAAGMDAEIHSIAIDGTESSVASMPHVQDPNSWVLSENGIYVVDRDANPRIWFYEFATSKVRTVKGLSKAPVEWGGIALSHDWRRLVYSQLDEKIGDITMVENYR
jgi:Tol biopolymer transport system component/DNA-binding winged helix-turn-helix (wHTH) protein